MLPSPSAPDLDSDEAWNPEVVIDAIITGAGRAGSGFGDPIERERERERE